MAGFKNRPGEKVNTIKNLLKERYKQGFPIIKEIIQNANDGGASALDFGISQGLGDSVEHPLLKNPGLFFLNNGTFTKSDQESITYFGIDSNAKDRGKIGKFGLGQKSIFHFCEAFFYIARSESIPDGCGEFINPWTAQDGDDPKRPEWIELSNRDQKKLEQYVSIHKLLPSNQSCVSFFLLWVPLRQKMIDERCILANYYDSIDSVKKGFPEDMEVRIGQLLPLLRHLETVRFFTENEPGSLEQVFSVSLCSDAGYPLSRCIYPNATSETIDSDDHDIQGKIKTSSYSEGVKFSGKEIILSYKNFLSLLKASTNKSVNSCKDFWIELQNSSFWSKRISFNDYGEDEIIPDKSIPHCAVILTQQSIGNQSQAKFNLQWAVFLPLASEDNLSQQEEAEQESHEYIDCDGDKNYTIFLHGYFFLDSGRKYIEGLQKIRRGLFIKKNPDNEDEMISHWNYLLATRGTLPLVLPSIKKLQEKHSLTDREISNLCRAILKSRLFSSEVYRQSVCAEHQWIFRVQPSNNAWELIPVDASLRVIPGTPPKWEAFPALEDIAQKNYFIIESQPNLLYRDKDCRWEKQEICSVLDSINPELVFSNSDHLRYLSDFCHLQGTMIQQPEVQASLTNLLRRGFRRFELPHLQEASLKPFIKQLVSKIIPHKRFKLKKVGHNTALNTILKDLYKLEINTFIVYEDFEVSPNSQGILTREGLIYLLTYLKDVVITSRASNHKNLAYQIIVQVLSSSDYIEQVLNQLEDVDLFIGYNYRDEKQHIYSYQELKDCQQKKCLFQGVWTSKISAGLKESLPNTDLIFIDKKLARIFGKTSSLRNIPECNVNSCLQLLRTQPDLAQADQRTNLLKELINHV